VAVERIMLPLALLGTGLAAGGLMISALGGAPLLLVLPTNQYVPVHQFLVTRFDPFMPISLCTGLVADAILTFWPAGPTAQFLAGTAAALLLIAVAVSLTKNVPINKWVARLDPDALPENFERLDPRVRWRNWNLVRTALAVAALLANVAAVGAVL
jgi:uncharacterized membrane protein